MNQSTDIYNLFFLQKRFDIMFKYLYLYYGEKYKTKTNFFEILYKEHIRIINHFYEKSPTKATCSDFVKSFDELYENIKKNGFNHQMTSIPVDANMQLTNGAHRLAACLAEKVNTNIEITSKIFDSKKFDYTLFQKNHMDSTYSDFAALEYVKLNPNSYIVNIFPIADPEFDEKVEEILNKYGFIYYKKYVYITYNGCVNLKKIFYRGEKWIGTKGSDFSGAKNHAKSSLGHYPMRIYVFVCTDIQKVRETKAEIRSLYDMGNFPIHINDTHLEAIEIAQNYFNENSLFLLNNRPYNYSDDYLDSLINKLKEKITQNNLDINEFCGCGSTPFSLLGIRASKDLDYLYCGEKTFDSLDKLISNHESQLDFYPYTKEEIILNPCYHFYYKGFKFISLDVLKLMKEKRKEHPKDIDDCILIKNFKHTAIDFSLMQNNNFIIYQELLQKIIKPLRSEFFKSQGEPQKTAKRKKNIFKEIERKIRNIRDHIKGYIYK